MSVILTLFDDYRLSLFLKYYFNISGNPDIFKGTAVLDVGGGEGKEALLVLKHSPQFFVLLDKDLPWLKNAKANLSYFDKKSFVCADAECLPLKDKSVDVVIFKDILHHLLESHNGITEGIRVSRKVIFIDEPAKGRIRDVINEIFVRLKIKERYEIREGRELKFRIDNNLLQRVREEQDVGVFYFPYLFYQFGFFEKVQNRLLKILLKKIVITLNVILPVKNRAIIIILPKDRDLN